MSSKARIPPPTRRSGSGQPPPAHLPPLSSARKGRGAVSNRDSRYLPTRVEMDAPQLITDAATGDPVDDCSAALATECRPEVAKSIIARNRSPDVPFDQSINPYRGCEHGCIYCYARPSHAWLDLSPGLDFETRLTWKTNAAEKLEQELRAPGYQCKPITIGANTDPYQPVEQRYQLTRQLLEAVRRFNQPVSLITKGQGILRDIDLLADMAADGLANVAISVTTLDRDLKRALEPRTADGQTRLKVVEALAGAGIPVSVLVAPIIPALNDRELETIVARSSEAGATSAGYILLRLPLEIRELFEEWLHSHYPLRAEHVMSLVRQCRGGRNNDPRFGHRMRGTGEFAELLSKRFDVACRRHGLNHRDERQALDCSQFRAPPAAGDQLSLL
ncbi:MAG: PA0069 family radical SAM protein [Halieaceae bacterium]|jgi:DNA repair photolyase|nr:PA0069 family radical SAM protein [Halieaceae bacterium]